MTSPTPAPTPSPRGEIEACADCGQSDAPYAYLEDQHHYCVRCARKLLIVEKLRPVGSREDDLTYEDVLFTDLPYSPTPEDSDTPEDTDTLGASATTDA